MRYIISDEGNATMHRQFLGKLIRILKKYFLARKWLFEFVIELLNNFYILGMFADVNDKPSNAVLGIELKKGLYLRLIQL